VKKHYLPERIVHYGMPLIITTVLPHDIIFCRKILSPTRPSVLFGPKFLMNSPFRIFMFANPLRALSPFKARFFQQQKFFSKF
jgi:hypothetical protein